MSLPAALRAQSAELSPNEEQAVVQYLRVLRSCCLPDGGITMTSYGRDGNSPIWIAPYFANHVALAMLVAHDREPNTEDVERVRKWIEWLVARQEPGGFWMDCTGTRARYQSNGFVDAHDSSAALFLLLVERYQRAGGTITTSMRSAAQASLKCILNVSDTDGLTWAKPDYKVKYLMDNIEVYAGLKAGEIFFTRLNEADAAACATQAAKMAQRLPAYYEANDARLFAWVLHPSGSYESSLKDLYPHGLAQLFGVAFIQPMSDTFARVESTFSPETGPTATGSERFLIAACRFGGNTEKKWREKVLADQSLTKSTTYSHRPALAILGLCAGADWMPKL